MHRIGNLWQQLISQKNFDEAWRNLRRHKSNYDSVKRMESKLPIVQAQIRAELESGTYKHGPYQQRTIFEPKERVIYIAKLKDRYVHHILLNVIVPYLERRMDDYSLACRKERGLHIGSKLAMQFIRSNDYYLKIDVRKFYPSINHAVLKQILRRIFKDEKVLWLLDEIINSFPGDTNCPIGNYTSQWFGNIYLTELDKFVRHRLKEHCYIRYCDDAVIFNNDKKRLAQDLEQIRLFMADTLKMQLSKAVINKYTVGLDYLGYVHRRNFVQLRKRTKKRVVKALSKLAKNLTQPQPDLQKINGTIGSYDGWMQHACSETFKRKYHFNYFVDWLKMKQFKDLKKKDDKYKSNYAKMPVSAVLGKTIVVQDYELRPSKICAGSKALYLYFTLDGVQNMIVTGSQILIEQMNSLEEKCEFECKIMQSGQGYRMQ